MNLQQLLGIELPIIQAPMAGVQGSELAVAVSNAGGLGSLPCAMLGHEQLRAEIAAIQRATDKPFNVNFFCHAAPQPDAVREARWQAELAPYYEEFGIDPGGIVPGPGRQPFDAATLAILQELKPPVVSFHFGLPAPDLLAGVKAWGAKIFCSATTVEEALHLESLGVDVVIAQGCEAGGHRGIFLSDNLHTQMGTFALLPQIRRAVKLPVIAAGGIADSAGIAAAIAMGAAGVQIGTTYLLCPEAKTSALHRAALRSDATSKTVLCNRFTGRPARAIENRLIRELGALGAAMPDFPLAAGALAPLRAAAEDRGANDFSPLWCGQNASGCQAIPAAELTRQLATDLC